MIIDSHIDLAGFVVSEPAFKRIAGGTSTAKLRVAYTERRFNRETGEWADGPTSFVTVLCWRTLADNVAVCLRKGEPVLVRGRLRVREYEGKEGSPRIAVEVEASSVGHDLSRGVAHFSRTRRAPGETAVENAEGLAAAGSQDNAENPVHPDHESAPDRPAPDRPAPDRPAPDRPAPDRPAPDRAAAPSHEAAPDHPARPGRRARRDGRGVADGRAGVAPAGNGADGEGEDGAGNGGADQDGGGDGVLDERAVAELASELAKAPDEVPA